jgi:hypothetical protein
VWSRGWGHYPDQAFALRTPSGDGTTRSIPSVSSIVGEASRGWILSTTRQDRTQLSLVGYDAIDRRLSTAAAAFRRPRPGDVAVMKAGSPMVYRSSTGLLSPVAHPTGAFATHSGTLVIAGQTGPSAAWATFDGRHWRSGSFSPARAVEGVAGAGNTIAVVLGGHLVNGVDSTRIVAVAVSYDGGRTWRIRQCPTGVVEALSTVVMPSGTVFFSTGTGQLLHQRPGHALVEVLHHPRTPLSLSKSGSKLYVLSRTAADHDVVHVTTDEGRTWTTSRH